MRTISILLLLLAFTFSHVDGQGNSVKHSTRYVIWLCPSKADKVHGIEIGPFESELFFRKTQKVNGITIVAIGSGLILPLILGGQPSGEFFNTGINCDSIGLLKSTVFDKDDNTHSTYNGLVISAAGVLGGTVNGLTISAFCGGEKTVNGISINLLLNLHSTMNGVAIAAFNGARKVRGLQIGLINRTVCLKGIQIGLWNKSRKRSLPFINWG